LIRSLDSCSAAHSIEHDMNTATSSRLILLAGLLAIVSCGGSKNPAAPDPGSPGPSGATITIANGGVTPKSVTVSKGQSVTFLNSDTRSHDMTSDPHPTHTQCPAINAVSTLSPGQSKLTNALTTATTCGFHDHNDPDNTSLQGSITIQ
jgi:plastocyanin